MEKGFVENGFIIDLSVAQNTSQLVSELNSVMEPPDVKGKRICLKLGELDLNQSQLLSVKALIESMDAEIAFIDTKSEQTEASAVSHGIIVSKFNEDAPMPACSTEEVNEDDNEAEEVEETIEAEAETLKEGETIEVHADMDNFSVEEEPVVTIEGIEDSYTEETAQELSEIIPSEHFETDFEKLAANEGLFSGEEASKYILLDTGDVLPASAEANSVDTKTLPTLYLNQTLRSGQTVTYEGNVLIIGDAHPGSEIVADGDVTVWGILGGIAHAGAKGNISAKVRALKLNAIQLRISGLYARRNDTLNVPYVQKTNEFTPEEALIEDGRIVIYKKLRRD